MNNLIARKIDLTTTFAPLASVRAVATITITAPPTNSDVAYLQGDSGQEVPLVPGEWHTFQRVNLAQIHVKGTVGDKITIVGGTW